MDETASTSYHHNRKTTVNLLREDFDGGPISLDEILEGMFLGNLTAAMSTDTLKAHKITYILTLDSVPLPTHILTMASLTTKYVQISDMPKEDLLYYMEDCIQFIDQALQNQRNILVHCYYGVSRSATIVIAYIMKKKNLSYGQAFELVKKKRKFIGPNQGFVQQLKLYHKMQYQIDPQHPKYKAYRLKLAADKVRKVKILPQSSLDVIKPDPGITQESPEPLVYRCKKCRRIVANKSNRLYHAKNISLKSKSDDAIDLVEETGDGIASARTETHTVNLTDGSPEDQQSIRLIDKIAEQIKKYSLGNKFGDADDDTVCKSILFVEPIAWMKDIFTQTQGRLYCPKCTQKLGNFSWINGCQCPCGIQVSPAFYLVPSRVEISGIVQNLQTTV